MGHFLGMRVQVRQQEIDLDAALDDMETEMRLEECRDKHVRPVTPSSCTCKQPNAAELQSSTSRLFCANQGNACPW